ncbi:MAG: ATP-binding cassette domain-containing protein [Bacteroidetes bacterium]|nr:ATP-binding cassette domain-containing protein [Bacteroidota bacterium]
MIELRNLRKSFEGKKVLHDVSSVMLAGKTNLIIGASGSGKTVLMKMMIGLIAADSGDVLYEGKDIARMSEEELRALRQQIGMLFQGSALFDSKTVEQNVMFPLEMFSKLRLRDKQRRVLEVLKHVNLKDALKKFPSEISGGMKKRVALARAIVLQPKYLFCDEPNSGLDPQNALLIDKLIAEITREHDITTVVNTHDMNTVMEYGDHILYMHQGHKRWEGSKEDIIFSKDQELNDFIFASSFLQKAKQAAALEEEHLHPHAGTRGPGKQA